MAPTMLSRGSGERRVVSGSVEEKPWDLELGDGEERGDPTMACEVGYALYEDGDHVDNATDICEAPAKRTFRHKAKAKESRLRTR